MDIQVTKIELVKAILDIDNSEFVQKIAEFIKKERTDFWNELSPAEQNEIKKGIEELNHGKRVSYDSFLKKIPNGSVLVGNRGSKTFEII